MSIKKSMLLLIVLSLTGCSSHVVKLNPVMTEKPRNTATNLTETLLCISENNQVVDDNVGVIIMVDSIIDGTIRNRSYSDGKLSDSGKEQLVNVLFEYLPKDKAILINDIPSFLLKNATGSSGLNEFGVPDKDKWNVYSKYYISEINKRRSIVGKGKITGAIVLLIRGVYSSFDGDEFFSTGFGTDIGNDGSNANAEANFGKASEMREISLILDVIDPRNNQIMDSKSLTISSHKTGVEYNFKITGSGGNEGFFGFSHESMIVEGIHGAQKTLIDAMAIWLLNKLLPEQVNLCLKDEESRIVNNEFSDKKLSPVEEKKEKTDEYL